jgi:hypothetical protein
MPSLDECNARSSMFALLSRGEIRRNISQVVPPSTTNELEREAASVRDQVADDPTQKAHHGGCDCPPCRTMQLKRECTSPTKSSPGFESWSSGDTTDGRILNSSKSNVRIDERVNVATDVSGRREFGPLHASNQAVQPIGTGHEDVLIAGNSRAANRPRRGTSSVPTTTSP